MIFRKKLYVKVKCSIKFIYLFIFIFYIFTTFFFLNFVTKLTVNSINYYYYYKINSNLVTLNNGHYFKWILIKNLCEIFSLGYLEVKWAKYRKN